MSPCWRWWISIELTAGWVSNSLWSGFGSPSRVGSPLMTRRRAPKTRCASHIGRRGPLLAMVSTGRPKRCLGMNQYPRRMLITAWSALRAASHAMSQPEFSAPTTRTRLPRGSSTLR